MSTLDASIAKRLDITVKQNQTFDAVLTFLDTDGAPVSLVGATAKMSVRQQDGCGCDIGCAGETPFDLVYKQDFYPDVTGAGNNQLAFEGELVLLSPGNYKYDILVVFVGGLQYYLLQGTFKVKKSYADI